MHSERSRARGNARADASESDDAKGLAAQLESHELRSHPFTALDARIGRRDVAAEREQHGHRVLGRGEDVRGRRVDDQNSALGARVDIDVVEPHPRPPDDAQAPAGIDQLAGDRGAAARDQRVGFRDRLE